MKLAFSGQFVVLACMGLAIAQPLDAKRPDDFIYKFVATPEEGPVDPAVTKRYTAQFSACQEQAVTTQENEACLAGEFARQDDLLNRTWRLSLRRMTPQLRGRLVAAQRRWIGERDSFCNALANEFRGGTIAPVIFADCRVEQTVRRAMWLEKVRKTSVAR